MRGKTIFAIIFFIIIQYSVPGQIINKSSVDTTIHSFTKSQNDSLKRLNVDTIFVINVENTPANGWMNLVIPIFVAIVGGLLAIYSVRLNIVKAARINWIENLRDNLSSYIACVSQIQNILDYLLFKSRLDKDPNNAIVEKSEKLNETFRESRKYGTKVKLYLNKEEPQHEILENLLDKYFAYGMENFASNNREKYNNEIKLLLNDIIDASRPILKKEWDKTSKTVLRRILEKIKKFLAVIMNK